MKDSSKQKIALIGTAGVPGRYGGFETLAHQLVEGMADSHDLRVYCSAKLYPRHEGRGTWKGAKRTFLPFRANGWQSIIYDVVSIFHAAFRSEVLVIFGVSGAVALPFIRLFSKKKVVVHIDGLEWKRAKWKGLARRFLKWSEKLALRYSDAHIADNPALERYTQETYGKEAWMIPYGGDQAFPVKANSQDRMNFPFLNYAYVFSVCRIEPENNVHLILEAFAQQPDRYLVMVGNWESSAYGRNLRSQFAEKANIRLLNPIYEGRKLNLLRSNCLAYVHGHSAGGTNPSLVEAMNLGLPVLAFDVIFNRETTDREAFFFKNADELSALLRNLKLHDFHRCGRAMAAIAQRKYTWKRIVEMYSQQLAALSDKSQAKNSLPGWNATNTLSPPNVN